MDNQTTNVPHRGFIIRVDSVSLWVAFMAFIKEQQNRNFSDGLVLPEWVYRGQADSQWSLASSFEREFGCEASENELVGIERASMDAFRELAIDSGASFSKAELLAHMQHYGVPTRLVDFTKAPLIALFFALNQGNGAFSVWATHLNAVNSRYDKDMRLDAACTADNSEKSIHVTASDSTRENNARRIQCERELFESFFERDEKWRTQIRDRVPMFCYVPTNPNPRMKAQRGLFLASSKLSCPFEDSFYEWKSFERRAFERETRPLSEIFKNRRVEPVYIANADALKFDFSPSMRNEAYAYLETANVRPSVMFPDFEGIAKEVKEEMQLLKGKLA